MYVFFSTIWNFILPSWEYHFSMKDFETIEFAIIELWDYWVLFGGLEKIIVNFPQLE